MALRYKPGVLIQSTIEEICNEKSKDQLWQDFMNAKADVLEDLYQEYLTNLAYSRLFGNDKILCQSVAELPIPSHTRNILKKQGIETVRDLINYSSIDLAHMSGFGQKSVGVIEDYLAHVGFELSRSPLADIKSGKF